MLEMSHFLSKNDADHRLPLPPILLDDLPAQQFLDTTPCISGAVRTLIGQCRDSRYSSLSWSARFNGICTGGCLSQTLHSNEYPPRIRRANLNTGKNSCLETACGTTSRVMRLHIRWNGIPFAFNQIGRKRQTDIQDGTIKAKSPLHSSIYIEEFCPGRSTPSRAGK